MTISLTARTLYDRDYALWLDTTVELLKTGQFSEIDLENLIEELAGMSRSERRAIESLIIRLLEYLIKLAYWKTESDRIADHWRGKINNFRHQISKLLSESPSLVPYLQEIFEESYRVSIENVSLTMGLKERTLPTTAIASIEQSLDKSWFPSVTEK